MSATADRVAEIQRGNVFSDAWRSFSYLFQDSSKRYPNNLNTYREFYLNFSRKMLFEYLEKSGFDDGEATQVGIGTSRFAMALVTCPNKKEVYLLNGTLYRSAPISLLFLDYDGIVDRTLRGQSVEGLPYLGEVILPYPYRSLPEELSTPRYRDLTMDELRELTSLIQRSKVYPLHDIVERRVKPKLYRGIISGLEALIERKVASDSQINQYSV